MMSGSLTIVGTGIRILSQLTSGAREAIRTADKLLYAVDAVTAKWMESVNPSAESLYLQHQPGKPRVATYEATIQRILTCVREGKIVCAAFYGHPGVFVYASHRSIQIARSEGFPARMLPGISAEDALLADLGVDPGMCGYASFESTDFLIRKRRFDPTSHLVLWQPDMIGLFGYEGGPNRKGLRALKEELFKYYSRQHPVILYLAAQFPQSDPIILRFPLERIDQISSWDLAPFCTFYIPPIRSRKPDLELGDRFQIPPDLWK